MVAQRQFLFILACVGLLAGCVGPGYDDGYSDGGYSNGGYSRGGYYGGGYAPSPYPQTVIQRAPDWGRRVYQEPPPRYQPERYEQPRQAPQYQRGPDRPPVQYVQPQAYYGRGQPQGCLDGSRFPCANKNDGQNGK